MNFENILVALENGIGQITINRPSKLNALNVATIKELHDAFESLGKIRPGRIYPDSKPEVLHKQP